MDLFFYKIISIFFLNAHYLNYQRKYFIIMSVLRLGWWMVNIQYININQIYQYNQGFYIPCTLIQ